LVKSRHPLDGGSVQPSRLAQWAECEQPLTIDFQVACQSLDQSRKGHRIHVQTVFQMERQQVVTHFVGFGFTKINGRGDAAGVLGALPQQKPPAVGLQAAPGITTRKVEDHDVAVAGRQRLHIVLNQGLELLVQFASGKRSEDVVVGEHNRRRPRIIGEQSADQGNHHVGIGHVGPPPPAMNAHDARALVSGRNVVPSPRYSGERVGVRGTTE
jgi:hypothetical protein